jgi:hypothetical protein
MTTRGAVRHVEVIWDAARPDSSPEAKDSGKIRWLEHVIANGRGAGASHPLERLAEP